MFFNIFCILLIALSLASLTLTKEKSTKGGLLDICPKAISRYMKRIHKLSSNFKWNPSVQRLAKLINSDPSLRYNWEYGISQSENIACYSSKQVFSILNAILNVGPSYDTSGLVGFPINVLFVHLMQNQNGRALFGDRYVNQALRDVLNDYGKMVLTKTSLTYMNDKNPHGWFSPKAKKKIDYSLYQCDPSQPHYGFKNWNEWFLRDFKHGKRVLGAGSPANVDEDDIIVNACEATPIAAPMQPTRKVKARAPFWLKGNLYSLVDIFGDYGHEKGYGALFVKGTVFQAFLSALSYHHWHAPVSGQIVDIYTIPGTYYLDQSQFLKKFDPSTPDMSQSFISHTAARMVYIIKADNPKLGYVGLVFIGMAECSGVESSKQVGAHVKKGDHIGNFLFGGSSYLMLFQKHPSLEFADTLYSKNCCGKVNQEQQEVLSYLATVE